MDFDGCLNHRERPITIDKNFDDNDQKREKLSCYLFMFIIQNKWELMNNCSIQYKN
jgi:hypothetical protein